MVRAHLCGFALVRDYRAAMTRYQPARPEAVGDGSYQPAKTYTFGSLEGYLNTKLLVAAITKAGPNLTRDAFKRAAESLTDVDVGLAKDKVTFGAVTSADTVRNHQGLKSVWLTIADGSQWRAVDSVTTLAQQLGGQ